jgi:quercetin dioxygenase-like cupin family protein
MAHKNKQLVNPVTRMDIRFIQTASDTGGELLEMESTFNGETIEPPPHYHPFQAEEFKILEGAIHTNIDGKFRVYKKGESIQLPAGTVHSMWNASDEKAILNWKVKPAMNTENFIETVAGLAKDGKTNKKGRPGILQVALLTSHFDNVFRLARPSKAIQRIVFGVLTPIAKLAGYKAVYKKYID